MSDPSRHEVQPGTGLKLSHHREWAEMKPGVITPGSFRNAAPRRPFIRLLVLALLGWQPVAGWWDTGHMLTAAIARTRLSAAARTMADELVIASASVQSSSPVPSVSFVSAAHWADDLKRRDWPASEKVHIAPDGLIVAFDAAQLNSMHYIDLPFGKARPRIECQFWNALMQKQCIGKGFTNAMSRRILTLCAEFFRRGWSILFYKRAERASEHSDCATKSQSHAGG
eukprot:SAG31_NODE_7_length_42755_cov_130.245728_38_plen_227_part_00